MIDRPTHLTDRPRADDAHLNLRIPPTHIHTHRWDWGPAFIPQGIIRDVVLFKSAIGELSDVLIQQTPQADGSVLVAATAVVQHVPANGQAWLSLALEGSGAPAVVNRKVNLVAGENEVGWLVACWGIGWVD